MAGDDGGGGDDGEEGDSEGHEKSIKENAKSMQGRGVVVCTRGCDANSRECIAASCRDAGRSRHTSNTIELHPRVKRKKEKDSYIDAVHTSYPRFLLFHTYDCGGERRAQSERSVKDLRSSA